MQFNGSQLFGNEWINTSQNYYKFYVSEDGLYRINRSTLEAVGIPVAQIQAAKFQLFHLGQEVAMYRSTYGQMGAADFLEFYGRKNRGELDAPLFTDSDHQLNPDHSVISDESCYFLTWSANDGARIEPTQNDLSNLLPADRYYEHTENFTYTNHFSKKHWGQQRALKSAHYDEGYGYGSSEFGIVDLRTQVKSTHKETFQFVHPYDPNDRFRIKIRDFGSGIELGTTHKMNILLNSNIVETYQFDNMEVYDAEFQIDPDHLRTGANALEFVPIASDYDYHVFSHIKVSYKKKYIFDQAKSVILPISASAIKKHLKFDEMDGGQEMLIIDLNNDLRLLSARQPDNSYSVELPFSLINRQVLAINPSEVKSISGLAPVTFNLPANANYGFVILTSKQLFNNQDRAVRDYIQYRESTDGGSHSVALVQIEDLYDAFSYGVMNHPIAIRNFAQYIKKKTWPNAEYFFIIGKGLQNPILREGAYQQEYHHVPTWGVPGSDLLMLSDNDGKVMFATGRIPATSASEVRAYFNKVVEHESQLTTLNTIKDRFWTKRVIHLSGGDPAIYQNISQQLAYMEGIIENNSFGAEVTTFYKESSGPVQSNNLEEFINKVNSGVSIISFMGHSGAARLDFNIPGVNELKNKGKYHMFNALGCYAGQVFDNNRSISEVFNLAPDKGSIIYLSNSTAGIIPILRDYMGNVYEKIGTEHYTEPIGKAVQSTTNEIIPTLPIEHTLTTQCMTAIFNGDPSIRFIQSKTPDYIPDVSSFRTEPIDLNVDLKHYDILVDIVNIGKNLKDSFTVKIEQKLPNGDITLLKKEKVEAPSQREEYSFRVEPQGSNSSGFNRILLSVDADDEITELPDPEAENNNELQSPSGENGVEVYFGSTGAKTIYPDNFAIINTKRPTLVASSINALSGRLKYTIEIDTTMHFNSPVKRTTIKDQVGGLLKWNIGFDVTPGVVYYWRISPEPKNGGKYQWSSSSFIYLGDGQTGWNQSHYFQFEQDNFENIKINPNSRQFEFENAIRGVRVTNAYIELPDYSRPKIYFDGDVAMDFKYWQHPAHTSGILLSLINSETGNLVNNPSGTAFLSEGGVGSTAQTNSYFYYDVKNPTSRQNLLNVLRDSIPDNYYVIIFTLRTYNNSFEPENWEDSFYDFFESIGASQMRQLKNLGALPYVFMYQKNNSQFSVKEVLGDLAREYEFSHGITFPFDNGALHSTVIGPSTQWLNFEWLNTTTANAIDQATIVGLRSDGSEQELFQLNHSGTQDLTSVSASEYPRLAVRWKSNNQLDREPSQLNFWRVFYHELPDAAWNRSTNYKFNSDTINQGDNLYFEMDIENVTTRNMDSLLVKYTFRDSKNKDVIVYKRYAPLPKNSSYGIKLNYSTDDLRGLQTFIAELNPNNDQPELHQFNNTLIKTFYVRPDFRKPYLDVLFDHVRIADGDIVSPKPEIKIYLTDENLSFPLEDTSVMRVWLKRSTDFTSRELFFSKDIDFIPASDNKNAHRINEAIAILHPELEDGTYELLVRGRDVSNNKASDQEFRVSFEVINKSSVSDFLNYPNPFTTKTHFIYTLTGDVTPEDYKIQIMSISGKIVKEISKNELGPLFPGRNMTSYAWNGTDDLGNKLANGVYLYRIIIKDAAGKSFDQYTDRQSDIQKYFKDGWGKMVLIR